MNSQNRKIIGLALIFFLALGVWLWGNYGPRQEKLPEDPQALKALNLVRNHLSREGYTLAESLQLLIDAMEKRGVTFREEDWQVASQGPDQFVVRKIVREKGTVEWIEREFAWRVNLKEESIRVISLAAQQLMPFENLPPLPHGDEISFIDLVLMKEERLG